VVKTNHLGGSTLTIDCSKQNTKMTEAEDFIYCLEGEQREIMLLLHQFLTNELGLNEKLRFKIPFYDRKTWICYLSPKKNGKVELAFIYGNELSNEQALLSCKGRKQVFGLEFEKVADIPFVALNEILQEALLIDESKIFGTKRKK
jgi:hypothetical protein